MTPRERARDWLRTRPIVGMENELTELLTEHVRALLADDEAGDMLRARQLFHYQRLTETFYDRLAKGFADYRAALRRKALG